MVNVQPGTEPEAPPPNDADEAPMPPMHRGPHAPAARPLRPEPGPARGGDAAAGPGARHRRRGLGQDPRAHAPARVPRRRARRVAVRDPRDHVHQQGRGRDEGARRRARRSGRAPHVGVDVPLRVLAHPAARGERCSATGRASRSTTRPTRSGFTDWVRRDLNLDPKRFPARQPARRDQRAEERAGAARGVRRDGGRARPSAGSPRCTPSTSAACSKRRPSTSTTCSCSPCACSASTPKRSSAGASASATCSSTSSRTRTLAQWELVRLLTEEHRNVMVVGDEDQCLVAGTQITMGDGHHEADRAGRRRRRGAVVLRQRRLPPGPRAARARVARVRRRRDHARERPRARDHRRPHALRRLRRRAARRSCT